MEFRTGLTLSISLTTIKMLKTIILILVAQIKFNLLIQDNIKIHGNVRNYQNATILTYIQFKW
jgi:hypothetical protein